MREIKYRAWHKKEKKMFDILEINFQTRYVRFDGMIATLDYRRICHFDNVELMQYTGLHDKNGKEIYEGDIVKFEGKTGDFIYSVFWDNEASAIKLKDLRCFEWTELILFEAVSQFEIIGNIYETKLEELK